MHRFSDALSLGPLTLALALALVMGGAARTALGAETTRPTVDVAMVISGGVSLGSYQAGGTWADLELLHARRDTHRLAVVTGASAGNINAFLAAIYWCDAESPAGRADRSVFANPFFDVWANIGWERLSPLRANGREYARLFEESVGSATFRAVSTGISRDGGGAHWFQTESPFTDEDGLFTRSGFAAAETFLAKRLLEARTSGRLCEVHVGVTVTRESAAEYPVEAVSAALRERPPADRGLRVPTQRYVVPLELVVDAEGGHLRNALAAGGAAWWTSPTHRRIAKALHVAVPDRATGDIPPAEVLRLVKASSAFPVVFAPIRLNVCLDPDDLGAARSATEGDCPGDTVPVGERFADGGFFDNVPLGLAMELVADRQSATRAPSVEYVYVDPENRRAARPKPPRNLRQRGVDQAWATLADVIAEARTYELQGLARHAARDIDCGADEPCPEGQRRFRASSRYHRIVGAYLVHNFAAFTHRVFRIHDYLVGVYDTVFMDAVGAGPGNLADSSGVLALMSAFGERLHALGLDVPKTPMAPAGVDRADELLWRLFRDEVEDRAPAGVLAAVCKAQGARVEVCSPAGAWRTDDHCLARPGASEPCPTVVLAVHDTLRMLQKRGAPVQQVLDPNTPDVVLSPEEDFDTFISALGDVLQAQGLTLPASNMADVPSSELAFDAGGPTGAVNEWSRSQHMRFIERALAIEAHDAAIWANEPGGAGAAPEDHTLFGLETQSLGWLALRTVPLLDPKPRERLDLDPSTVDAFVRRDASLGRHILGTFYHLLPWELGWDARRLGPLLGWEPRFDVFDSRITPRLRYEGTLARHERHATLFHRLGAGAGLDGLVGGTAMLTLGRSWRPGQDAEETPRRPWGAGVAMSVDVLRTLRITLGMDRLVALPEPKWTGREVYVLWSLLDVNGGLAWLTLSH